MNKSKILAKPSGISLKDHTKHVVEQAERILNAFPYLEQKYRDLTGEDLRSKLLLAAEYHDLGKKHPRWQKACRADFDHYLSWCKANHTLDEVHNPDNYRKYEASLKGIGYGPGKHLFRAGLRHEFASLRFLEKRGLQLAPDIRAAIAAHHNKLHHKQEHRWREDGRGVDKKAGPFFHLWKDFKRLDYHQHTAGSNLPSRFKFSALRALLKLADTRASRLETYGEGALPTLTPFKISRRYETLRAVQMAAVELSEEPISILRAPTGSGKTYASLLWAEQQVKAGRADRLIVAMPTRFTSNALAVDASEQLSETGLYHSSAWQNHYKSEYQDSYQAREVMRMARMFVTPATVCTIDHLMMCLSGVKEHHHDGFYFMMNSAIVFDEADFYDPFVQANLVVLINALRELKAPILIMSASVPDSSRVLYGIDPMVKTPLDESKELPSKTIRYMGPDEHCEPRIYQIFDQMLEKGEGIIYANTVARALKYFEYLRSNSCDKSLPLLLYHSRYTEPDKKCIESQLLAALGKESWLKGEKRGKGIAVLTQIGEMSVNISSTLMLSDLCPWDRLSQRVGRLVRFGAKKGTCFIVVPHQDGTLYPAPYGEYSQDEKQWIAYSSLSETMKDLEEFSQEGREITPDDLVRLTNKLYPKPPEFIDSVDSNQRNYRQLIRQNWLILPNTSVNELEETSVGHDWSTRSIPPHISVFKLEDIPPQFRSADELYELASEAAVSCPLYLVEREMRKGENSKITSLERQIGDRDQKENIYCTSSYDPKLGMAFLYGYERIDSKNQCL